jgi:hypothetical protein
MCPGTAQQAAAVTRCCCAFPSPNGPSRMHNSIIIAFKLLRSAGSACGAAGCSCTPAQAAATVPRWAHNASKAFADRTAANIFYIKHQTLLRDLQTVDAAEMHPLPAMDGWVQPDSAHRHPPSRVAPRKSFTYYNQVTASICCP